ncbi:MAG: hypothetical protein H0V84_07915 [Actinobacteria bacterium]|nr:hypothetical protein [Actinomycetota bacterium]
MSTHALRKARLAATVVVAAVGLYGVAGHVVHQAMKGHDAPLHSIGLCLVLLTVGGAFIVPRRPSSLQGRRLLRAFVAVPLRPAVGPAGRAARTSPAWLQRYLT